MPSIITWILVATAPTFWSKMDRSNLQQKWNNSTCKKSNFKYMLTKSLCRTNPACLMDIATCIQQKKSNFVSVALVFDTKHSFDCFYQIINNKLTQLLNIICYLILVQ